MRKLPEVERRQLKLQKNSEDTDRWMRKLLAAAHVLERLRKERKRLLKGPRQRAARAAYKQLADVPRMAAGGDEFNDEIPL